MQRYVLIFLSVLLVPAALTFIDASTAEKASANPALLVLSEDTVSGRVNVETNTIKGVWHYKALAEENYNQGGGNLYELYYKPRDGQMALNLVSFARVPNWLNGRYTATSFGIGGVGATTIYAADSRPESPYSTLDYMLGDNNLSGTLENHSARIDQQGNAVLTFSYRVRNQSTDKEWYRVVKQWTVEPGGTIRLKIDWTILNSGFFSEPALHAKWAREAKWDRFNKYGSDWSRPAQQKYVLGVSGLAARYLPDSGQQPGTTIFKNWVSLDMYYPDRVSVVGSDAAPNISMVADNDGRGLIGSGSYQLGINVWGYSPGATVEENIGQIVVTRAGQDIKIGEYGMHWLTWWGGSPPAGNRYVWIDAGTSWTDTYRIDLADSAPGNGPDISSVVVEDLTTSSARLTWSTDVDAESIVEVPGTAGSWRVAAEDRTLKMNHSLVIQGLSPQSTYSLQIKSRDGSGSLAVSGGHSLDTPARPDFDVAIGGAEVYWNSYSDYMNKIMSVNFMVENRGSTLARSVNIEDVSATGNVTAVNSLPITVGDVPSGTSSSVIVMYAVPSGVTNFLTTLFGTALDLNGETIRFPRAGSS